MKKLLCVVAFLVIAISYAQESIQLNLEEGKTYTLIAEITSEVNQVVGAQSINQTMIITDETDYVVTGIKDGNYLIDIIPRKVKNVTKSMGQEMVQDSEGDTLNPMNLMMKNLTNQVLKLVVSKDGELVDFDSNGYGNSLMEGVEMDDMMKLRIQGAVKAQLTDEKLKESYARAFQTFSNSQKKDGATWTTQGQTEMMMTQLDLTNTFTLKSIADGQLIIESVGNMTTGGEKEAMVQGTMVKVSMDGDVRGESTLDEETGWVKTASSETNAKGKMIFPAGTMGADPTPVDIDMKINVKIEGMIKE